MLVENTHGNINSPVLAGDHFSPITSAKPSDPMAWKTPENNPPPPSAAEQPPVRPPLTSHQSNSLPSTPYQHTRNLSFHSRSPSPRHGNTSPRSTHSETTHIPPSLRKPFAGCKYETAMAFFRRRMPYTIGTDLLEEEKDGLKEKLDPEEEHKMTTDIMDVYDRLLPSAESDDRRRQLVSKLEKLFNDQWPGHNIKVNVFGSSGNKLCSSDSDVDICITTTYKELEHVCLLAEVLARHGMERVVCISHAKVPIVKIWDPELRLACDMNVNNTLALENTRMVRTYVDIDERVRPLAMMIKHWTKRRILNDAGLGGTLSSYTWICLIINFFQTRNPPILPSLQARPHKKRTTPEGLMCSFDDDLNALSGFGKKNKQSLGELFFQFFRYYAHELNYEKDVISVREGRLVSKEGKGWHLLQNNRLCVEEPFNTSRNLGNTADDTSFRGIHIELRRAFRFLSDGNLALCCEQYEYPPEEERTWERPPPQPRPVLSAVPSNAARGGGAGGGRGGAGGAGRGGRNQNQFGGAGGGRGGGHTGGGRRASNTPNKTNNNFRNTNTGMSPSEISLQAQHAQYLLHDHLYQQIQILQAQEQELRLQLQNQALLTGRPPPVLVRQPFIQFPLPQQQQQQQQSSQQQPNSSSSQNQQQSPPDPSSPPPPSTSSGGDENSRSRSGTTAGTRPQFYYNPTYLPMAASAAAAATAATGAQGGGGGATNAANPPSPSTSAAAVPDLRRNPRRSSVANGSPGGSLRAQSQPARTLNSSALPNLAPLYALSQPMDASQSSKPRQGSGASQEGSTQGDDDHAGMTTPSNNSLPNGFRSNNYLDESRSSEYMGYYLAASQQLQAYHQSMLSNLPATAPLGLALQNGGYIPIMNPQDYMAALSASNDAYASSTGTTPTSNGKSSTPQSQQQQQQQQQQSQAPQEQSQSQRSTPRAATSNDRGPLIVDGSVPPSEPRPVYPNPIDSIDPYASWSQYTANSSDDPNTDTPASASDTFSQDYQDSSSVDIDNPSSLYSRSQPDTNTNTGNNTNKASKVTEPLVNGNNYVKPGTLSSRLQNLHCSNNEKGVVDSHKMGQDRSKGTTTMTYHHDQNSSPVKEATPKNLRPAASTTGEKGLSVTGTETSTSAHNSRRRQPNGVEASEKANGTNNHRSRPKGGGHHHGSTGDKERKTNGVNVTVHESNHHSSNNHATGGWQTTKKKQKKGGARSTNTGGGGGGGVHNGVEPLPVDESMRKGG